jgi:hypothetical protein
MGGSLRQAGMKCRRVAQAARLDAIDDPKNAMDR